MTSYEPVLAVPHSKIPGACDLTLVYPAHQPLCISVRWEVGAAMAQQFGPQGGYVAAWRMYELEQLLASQMPLQCSCVLDTCGVVFSP